MKNEPQNINLQSYTARFPNDACMVKVAIKPKNWNQLQPTDSCKAVVLEGAMYDTGFVSLDGGQDWHLAGNFIFHKLKRNKVKTNK